MTRLTDSELRELREAAEGAGGDGWNYGEQRTRESGILWPAAFRVNAADMTELVALFGDENYQRHALAADPSTVLRLVEEVERLRRGERDDDG